MRKPGGVVCAAKNCVNKTYNSEMRFFNFPKDEGSPTEPVTFQDSIKYRREQAKRSILVQVQSTESCKELSSYCSTMGKIQQMLHYTTTSDQLNFVIVEFSDEQHVSDIIQNSSHINTNESFPIHSNFLWFKASNRKNSKLKTAKNFKLAMENGNVIPSMKEVYDLLLGLDNVSQQIEVLHDVTKLNEVATRLRFLTTRQVELSVAGMFPHAVAYPFGSSVNGFGKMGCDLDIVFKLTEAEIKNDSRLVFHCKANNMYERSITHRHMEVIGDMLQLFLPGCTQIRKILQARVPIIKYYQQFTDVECDLSMSNMSGVCMSDLLYLYGSIDARVRPLVFTIRKWAQEVGITNNSPGRWISNFSLTLLVLAFLQRPDKSPPILPSVHHVLQQIGLKCENVLEETLQFSFSKSAKVLKFEGRNTDDLESLLKQFFNFYSSFDFSSNAINLNEAISITKPEHSPLYIVNPLERGLNVSKM
ncbi:hypothetical protein RI129_002165 [Pyrocoelia pectoralis]|uniref:Poly(A) RNA polymerase, mitochondrial n=1 Tax=Pyrocoelia pectoralis TaxID=417401 RepID=A0AAN7ZSU6_9COLE